MLITQCFSQLIDLLLVLKVGSIEGRVGVHHVDETQQGKNFTFKCHRDGNDIYSVNSLNFHPVRPVSSIICYSNSLYHHFLGLKFFEIHENEVVESNFLSSPYLGSPFKL